MENITQRNIEILWRRCEHIAHSGQNEWRFDENGVPIRYQDYLKQDKKGGWFIKEDEQQVYHIYSYACLRTLL